MSTINRLYTFIPGQRIVAVQMNEELNQLVNGHNDHDGRIVIAEGKIDVLEEQVQDIVDQNIPPGSVTFAMLSSDVVNDINSKAPKASPAFSGTPTGPTAPASANTTQLATTAFVQTVAAASRPFIAGTYTGNDAAVRDIALPFTPSAVWVIENAFTGTGWGSNSGGLAVTGSPVRTDGTSPVDSVTIITNGFRVYYTVSKVGTNISGSVYNYIAFKG